MINIIESKRNEKNGIWTLKTAEDEKLHLSHIFAGISWPIAATPAYFCLIGCEHTEETRYEGMETPEGRLILLTEAEVSPIDLTGLCRQFTDAAITYGCNRTFGPSMPEGSDAQDFCKFLRAYVWEHKLSGVPMPEPAPSADNFLLGLGVVRKHTVENGRLTLPDNSPIRAQLKGLTVQDLEDRPDQRFHAVNAARFALCGMDKHGYYRKPFKLVRRPARHIGGNPVGH